MPLKVTYVSCQAAGVVGFFMFVFFFEGCYVVVVQMVSYNGEEGT